MDEDQVRSKPTPEQTQAEKQRPPTFAWLKTILVSSFVSILIAGLSFYVYDTHFALKIVTVDLKGFIKTQQQLSFSGAIDQETMKINIRTLSEKIKSIPKNTTILIKEVVVTDEKSLTY